MSVITSYGGFLNTLSFPFPSSRPCSSLLFMLSGFPVLSVVFGASPLKSSFVYVRARWPNTTARYARFDESSSYCSRSTKFTPHYLLASWTHVCSYLICCPFLLTAHNDFGEIFLPTLIPQLQIIIKNDRRMLTISSFVPLYQDKITRFAIGPHHRPSHLLSFRVLFHLSSLPVFSSVVNHRPKIYHVSFLYPQYSIMTIFFCRRRSLHKPQDHFHRPTFQLFKVENDYLNLYYCCFYIWFSSYALEHHPHRFFNDNHKTQHPLKTNPGALCPSR